MKDKLAGTLLIAVGILQMAGDVAGIPALRGIGAATNASPAPKVFSAVRGLETYSTEFALEWTDGSGEPRSLALTPEIYGRIRGPYNRRNVYGAALAYAPVLPPELRDPVMRYALCGEAPLLAELGIEPPARDLAVTLTPLPGTRLAPGLDTRVETECP